MASLRVAGPTLYAKIKDGRLHPIKMGKRNYFHPDEVRAERERLDSMNRMGRPPGVSGPASFPLSATKTKPPVHVPPPAPKPHPTVLNYDGETASAAYRMFSDNKGIRDAVIDLAITAELAEHLYEHWKKAGPELHIPPKALARIRNRFEWFDTPTPEGFMKAMDAFIDREVSRLAREHGVQLEESQPIPDAEKQQLEEALAAESEDQ